MHRYLTILGVHSAKELIRYKSFFLLIFILIAVDRVVHRYVDVEKFSVGPADIIKMGPEAARFIFETLPGKLFEWIFDYRTAALILGMFVLKQIISLWPSSDMRRMHRRERKGLGIFTALLVLRWRQVFWDATAVGSVCIGVLIWTGIWFAACRFFWLQMPSPLWVLVWAGLVMLVAPLVMAGFSFSSKIAVLSRGSFSEKMMLFFKLVTDKSVFIPAWIFFVARIVIEFVFVVAIPGAAILWIPSFALRIIVASLSATLVYSYLKMATFKFFLLTYDRFPYVQQEYDRYYQSLQALHLSPQSAADPQLAPSDTTH